MPQPIIARHGGPWWTGEQKKKRVSPAGFRGLKSELKWGLDLGPHWYISPREHGSLSTHTEDGLVSDLFEKARPDLLELATEEGVSSAQPVPASEQTPGKNTSVEKPGSCRQGRQD